MAHQSSDLNRMQRDLTTVKDAVSTNTKLLTLAALTVVQSAVTAGMGDHTRAHSASDSSTPPSAGSEPTIATTQTRPTADAGNTTYPTPTWATIMQTTPTMSAKHPTPIAAQSATPPTSTFAAPNRKRTHASSTALISSNVSAHTQAPVQYKRRELFGNFLDYGAYVYRTVVIGQRVRWYNGDMEGVVEDKERNKNGALFLHVRRQTRATERHHGRGEIVKFWAAFDTYLL